MSVTFTESVTLVKEECCTCGVAFAIPKSLQDNYRKHHTSFYCPSGHSQSYTGKTDAEILRLELERQKAETIRQRDNYFAEQRKHELTQKAMAKLKKRTAAGVCPCCQRTFQQLSRHMQTKHQEFVKEHGIPEVKQVLEG